MNNAGVGYYSDVDIVIGIEEYNMVGKGRESVQLERERR
jgi:hypothetical protein